MTRPNQVLEDALQPIVDQLDDSELGVLEELIRKRRSRRHGPQTETQGVDMGAVPPSETRS